MSAIEKVYQFLDEAHTYYLATVEGDQPRVRAFGTALLYDGKLYIQTGKGKTFLSGKEVGSLPGVWDGDGGEGAHTYQLNLDPDPTMGFGCAFPGVRRSITRGQPCLLGGCCCLFSLG